MLLKTPDYPDRENILRRFNMTEKDTTYTKYNKKYYQKNKQRIQEHYREHYYLNKQAHIEYVTKYRKEHRTKLNERIYLNIIIIIIL